MEMFLALTIDDYPDEWCHSGEAKTVSKHVLYQDLLLGVFDKNFDGIDLKEHYKSKIDYLEFVEIPSE